MKKNLITVQEAAAVLMVRNGADVWNRLEAGVFRQLEKTTGRDIIQIVKAQNAPANGAERQPYFGVIATRAGVEMAKSLLKKHYAISRFTTKRAERIFLQVSL